MILVEGESPPYCIASGVFASGLRIGLLKYIRPLVAPSTRALMTIARRSLVPDIYLGRRQLLEGEIEIDRVRTVGGGRPSVEKKRRKSSPA